MQDPLPVWVAVGGTPQSVVRAGALGLPMALAIIGGQPARFAPFAELHREAAREAGHEPPPLSASTRTASSPTRRRPRPTRPSRRTSVMDRIGRERGWPPMTREQFEAARDAARRELRRQPEQVIEKILFQHEIFGHDRFLLQMSVGTLPHAR